MDLDYVCTIGHTKRIPRAHFLTEDIGEFPEVMNSAVLPSTAVSACYEWDVSRPSNRFCCHSLNSGVKLKPGYGDHQSNC